MIVDKETKQVFHNIEEILKHYEKRSHSQKEAEAFVLSDFGKRFVYLRDDSVETRNANGCTYLADERPIKGIEGKIESR